MKEKEILSLTAVQLGKKIKEREVTCREALEAVFAQIGRREPELNCYVTLEEEKAFKQAEEVQRGIDEGTLTGPLAGVPVAVKDNMCIEGMRTTCSSKILENFVPAYTAEAVERLRKAGAVIIGKTNMDEFAWAVRRRRPPSESRETPGTRIMCQAVRQAVPAPRLRQMNAFMRLVPIRAGPYGSPAHSAG